MQGSLKAVIFDMDGILIESEHLWRRAMIVGFKEAGMTVSEDDCRKTMGLRIGEVIHLWLNHFNLRTVSASRLETRIATLLVELIEEDGKFIQGVPALLAFCREKKLKIGLATSSSQLLMNVVLKKLDLMNGFDAALSAEFLKYGKPHPEVFLQCAEKLNVQPQECLVIEDSLNGVIAARAAQMKVIAVPDDEHRQMGEFAVAHYKLNTMTEVLALFKTLLP
jgi:HAD superfamily hydrolase (TIGR01509 family)